METHMITKEEWLELKDLDGNLSKRRKNQITKKITKRLLYINGFFEKLYSPKYEIDFVEEYEFNYNCYDPLFKDEKDFIYIGWYFCPYEQLMMDINIPMSWLWEDFDFLGKVTQNFKAREKRRIKKQEKEDTILQQIKAKLTKTELEYIINSLIADPSVQRKYFRQSANSF